MRSENLITFSDLISITLLLLIRYLTDYTQKEPHSVYFCVHILSYSTSFTKRTARPLQR